MKISRDGIGLISEKQKARVQSFIDKGGILSSNTDDLKLSEAKDLNPSQMLDLDLVIEHHPDILMSFLNLPMENIRFDDDLIAFDINDDSKKYTFIFSKTNFSRVFKYFTSETKLGSTIFSQIFGSKSSI